MASAFKMPYACHLTEENLSAFGFLGQASDLSPTLNDSLKLFIAQECWLWQRTAGLKINTTGLSSHSDHCWLHISHTAWEDMLN